MTLSRKLRTVIREVLIGKGIDDEALVLDLAKAVQFIFPKKASVEFRHTDDIIDLMLSQAPGMSEQDNVQNRLESLFKMSPDWGNREWDRLAKFLLKKQGEGQTVEAFSDWYFRDDFRRTSVIYITPTKIMMWWPQAFDEQKGVMEGV